MPAVWHARVCSLQPYLPQAQQPDVELLWDGVFHPALASANLVFSSMKTAFTCVCERPHGSSIHPGDQCRWDQICQWRMVDALQPYWELPWASGKWGLLCQPRLTYYPVCVLPAGLVQYLARMSPSQTITPQVPGSPADMVHHARIHQGLGMLWLCPAGTCQISRGLVHSLSPMVTPWLAWRLCHQLHHKIPEVWRPVPALLPQLTSH